jgi:hypothetical protein
MADDERLRDCLKRVTPPPWPATCWSRSLRTVDAELDMIELTLLATPPDEAGRSTARLQLLLFGLGKAQRPEDSVTIVEKIQTASDEEIF